MKGLERGEPLSTFAKPPEPREQVTADDFMVALDNFLMAVPATSVAPYQAKERARDELYRCVEAIFARLDG